MQKVDVTLANRSYSIYIQSNILNDLSSYLSEILCSKTVVMITDKKVHGLYGDQIAESLAKQDYQVHLHTVRTGERSKRLKTVSDIYTWMLERSLPRDIAVIALGGGVIGDLAGFVAATYLRGVRLIQLPTTLLAQVDSSVGGKVGVNHALGKNTIGAFYQPELVLIDPTVLRTLEKRELYCGLSEIVKYGLILDAELFEDIRINTSKIVSLSDDEWLERVIAQCCRLKAAVVQQDEKESGLRRILNYGHTVGHALETATRYSYFTHGEAISWGMLVAAKISCELGYLTKPDFEIIQKTIAHLKKAPVPQTLDSEELLNLMFRDKKMSQQGLNFVLLKKIGEATVEIIDRDLLLTGMSILHDH